MMILVLGVMRAATDSITEETLGWPCWLGASLALASVSTLNLYGKKAITHFKTAGTVFLYLGYLTFSGTVILSQYDSIQTLLSTSNGPTLPDGRILAAI